MDGGISLCFRFVAVKTIETGFRTTQSIKESILAGFRDAHLSLIDVPWLEQMNNSFITMNTRRWMVVFSVNSFQILKYSCMYEARKQ